MANDQGGLGQQMSSPATALTISCVCTPMRQDPCCPPQTPPPQFAPPPPPPPPMQQMGGQPVCICTPSILY
jgi:hypothetical protein